MISLSALLAVEAAAEKAADARADGGARGSGMVDIQGLAAGEEQERSSYLDLFPFGAPAELPAFRPPDLTPVPSEVPIGLGPPRARRAAAVVRAGAMGLVGAAVVASAVWLGAPREALRAAAQAGVRQAAGAALAQVPKVEARPAAPEPPPARQADTARDRAARGAKARPAAPSGGDKAAAKRAAATRAPAAPTAAAAPPPSQGGARAAGDPCKGDLDCAMRRALGGS
ncbi:hypothetical protein [Sorangium sp. So ce1097]|uniref:hypothetical protein n=1 Tax=Sorangium sp. So ce1097 TaxID=3133330 RepID=UPI003F5F2897